MSKYDTIDKFILSRMEELELQNKELLRDNTKLKERIRRKDEVPDNATYATVNHHKELALSYRIAYSSDIKEVLGDDGIISKINTLLDDRDKLIEFSNTKTNNSYGQPHIITRHEEKYDFVFSFGGVSTLLSYYNYNEEKYFNTYNYDTGKFTDYFPESKDKEMFELALEELKVQLVRIKNRVENDNE